MAARIGPERTVPGGGFGAVATAETFEGVCPKNVCGLYIDAQAASIATPVARRLAKSARQVIDESEVEVLVVAASATSRSCSTRQ